MSIIDSEKADELARAAWPEPRLGLSQKHLAVAGLHATEYMRGRFVIASRNGDQFFRGPLADAIIWLAEQPPVQPPKYVDPKAELRADVNERLASLSADAATMVKQDLDDAAGWKELRARATASSKLPLLENAVHFDALSLAEASKVLDQWDALDKFWKENLL